MFVCLLACRWLRPDAGSPHQALDLPIRFPDRGATRSVSGRIRCGSDPSASFLGLLCDLRGLMIIRNTTTCMCMCVCASVQEKQEQQQQTSLFSPPSLSDDSLAASLSIAIDAVCPTRPAPERSCALRTPPYRHQRCRLLRST